MSRREQQIAKFMTAVIPLVFIAVILIREPIISLSRHFPACVFYTSTGYLCPACGNTRCIQALLHGRIFEALGYNIIPPILAILALAGYAELATAAFGRHKAIIPRSYIFLFAVLGISFAYMILRNIFPALTICWI